MYIRERDPSFRGCLVDYLMPQEEWDELIARDPGAQGGFKDGVTFLAGDEGLLTSMQALQTASHYHIASLACMQSDPARAQEGFLLALQLSMYGAARLHSFLMGEAAGASEERKTRAMMMEHVPRQMRPLLEDPSFFRAEAGSAELPGAAAQSATGPRATKDATVAVPAVPAAAPTTVKESIPTEATPNTSPETPTLPATATPMAVERHPTAMAATAVPTQQPTAAVGSTSGQPALALVLPGLPLPNPGPKPPLQRQLPSARPPPPPAPRQPAPRAGPYQAQSGWGRPPSWQSQGRGGPAYAQARPPPQASTQSQTAPQSRKSHWDRRDEQPRTPRGYRFEPVRGGGGPRPRRF